MINTLLQTRLRQHLQGQHLLAGCLALTLFGTGCTYRDPSVDILEGELRWMEDQLYFLEDELARTCAELEQCRCGSICDCGECDECLRGPHASDSANEGHTVERPSNDGYTIVDEGIEQIRPDANYEVVPAEPQPTPALRDDTLEPSQPALDDFSPPETELPDAERTNPMPATPSSDTSGEFEILDPVIEMPQIETGDAPVETELPAPLPEPETPGLRPLIEPPGADSGGPEESDLSIRLQSFSAASEQTEESAASDTDTVDAHVTHVVAKGRLAIGADFDGDTSDDVDILAIVEPRNADGDYIALAGPVSLVVLDGNEQGESARIARWDFDAAAVRRRLRVSTAGRGAHFELKWPESEPKSDELYLFVRYVTVEGRRLEADVPLRVDREAETNGQWKVVNRGNRLATWTEKSVSESSEPSEESRALTPVRRQIQLESIPHEEQLSSDQDSQGSDQQPSSDDASSPEMPKLIDSDVPDWNPDR